MVLEVQIVNMSMSVMVEPNGTIAADFNQTAQLSDPFEKMISLIVPIIFACVVVIGFIGNGLVAIVIVFNKRMRSATNILILNLAIADLFFIMFCVPTTAWSYATEIWVFGEAWCKINQYLIYVCAYASIYTLTIMTLERYLGIIYPIASLRIRTSKNASMIVSIVWLFVLVLCIPVIYLYGLVRLSDKYEEEQIICSFLSIYNEPTFQTVFFLTSFAVPLVVIFVVYLLILKNFWLSGTTFHDHSNSTRNRNRNRTTKMVLIVVFVFAICWCPLQVILLLRSLDLYHLNEVTLILQITGHVLAYTNSCINPILYAFISRNFRSSFRKVLTQFAGTQNGFNLRAQSFSVSHMERSL